MTNPDPILGEVLISGMTIYALVSIAKTNGKSIDSGTSLWASADYSIDIPNVIGKLKLTIMGADKHFLLLSATLSKDLNFANEAYPLYCNVNMILLGRQLNFVDVPICPPVKSHISESSSHISQKWPLYF